MATQFKAAEIFRFDEAWLGVSFRYDEPVQADLMDLGAGNRRWNGKVWLVLRPYGREVMEILTKHGYTICVADELKAPAPAITEGKHNPYDSLFTWPGMSSELRRKLYIAHVKELHPDRGGDATLMQLLNMAMERYK